MGSVQLRVHREPIILLHNSLGLSKNLLICLLQINELRWEYATADIIRNKWISHVRIILSQYQRFLKNLLICSMQSSMVSLNR